MWFMIDREKRGKRNKEKKKKEKCNSIRLSLKTHVTFSLIT